MLIAIIVLVLAAMLGIEWRLHVYKAKSQTPYERIRRRQMGLGTSGLQGGKVFDIFMSYKSEDVTVVRQITEQLIARDITVWFAEYTIAVNERPRFQEAIDAGIRRSRYGVCFTNNKYVDSPYCRREVEQLLDPLNCGPHKVVEFQFPSETRPHLAYPQLTGSHSVEYEGIDQALRYIASATEMRIRPLSTPYESTPNLQNFQYRGREYALDLAGWESVQRQYRNRQGPDMEGPKFSAMCGGNPMWGHVIVGPQDVSRGAVAIGTLDDRAYYEEALKFADRFFKSIWQQKLVGVHLLFAAGFSHMALTTLFKPGIWSRLYSVVLPYPGEATDVEFAFFFFFKGNFKEFCANANRMDRVVESIRW